jgi:chemotaxis protein methyltransferase CheR
MIRTLPDIKLQKLSEFIELKLALHFPKERWDDLERNIRSAAKEFEYQDVDSFIQHIVSSPLTREHSELLAAHLTISETYFWREPESFEVLEQMILPELIRLRQKNNKRIRIWSAGCSGGEEPYSIAIALTRIIPDIKNWNISILATDINPRNLQKAVTGEYGAWSFRTSPKWLKEKYFIEKNKGHFQIIPAIKNMVTFEYLNLAENDYPSPLNHTNAMDIIYCRNVLMYFNQERFRLVAKGLYNSLIEGGYFVVSSSELSTQNFPDFLPVNIPGFVLYQKNSSNKRKQNKNEISETKPEPTPVFVQDLVKPNLSETESSVFKEEDILQTTDQIYEEILNTYSKGNYPEVINRLQKVDLSPDEQILLIRAYANTGKLSDALTECQKAILTRKLDSKIHYLYASILQELKQPDEAIAALKRAIYIDPDFVLSYYSLGNLYLKKGNMDATKKYYKNILSIINKWSDDEIVPESEGLTTGRFKQIINATLKTAALS